MRRHRAKNADYRGSVTCLYDTQLLGACLDASESGGRSHPEAVRGMPDVPIAPPATRPPEGRRLSALSAQPLSTGGCGRVCLGFWGRKESGSGLLTVSDPGLILPESACRWPQVFHTQGIRLCPMTLFNPVFNCLTPIVVKRSKTQAEEGLTPADEAGSVVLRQPPASKLANLTRAVFSTISWPHHATFWRSCTELLPGRSLLKQHPVRNCFGMKRRSHGFREDFMLAVSTEQQLSERWP